MVGEYEQIPPGIGGNLTSNPLLPVPSFTGKEAPLTPYPSPAISQTTPGQPPAFPSGKIPQAPSEKIACCDAKTMVLVSSSLLLFCELIHVLWYGLREAYIEAAISGSVAILCLLLYFNAFGLKSAPFHVIMGTLMLMITVGKGIYTTFSLLPNYNEYTTVCKELQDRCPPIETYLMSLVIIIGLVQMYRVQNFKDSYDAFLPKMIEKSGADAASDDPEAANTNSGKAKKNNEFFEKKKNCKKRKQKN